MAEAFKELLQRSDVVVVLGLSSLKCNIINAEHPPRPLLEKLATELRRRLVSNIGSTYCYLWQYSH